MHEGKYLLLKRSKESEFVLPQVRSLPRVKVLPGFSLSGSKMSSFPRNVLFEIAHSCLSASTGS